MAENDLYATTGAVGSGYGDQMDPLGTAGQNAGSGAEHVEPVLGAAPAAASVRIGRTPQPKKKFSTGKKIAYGAGGLVAGFLGLIAVLDPGPQQGTASPKPPTAALVVAEQAAPAALEPTTVMGGSPAVELLDVPPGAQPAAMEAPAIAAAPAASPAPAPAAPAPAPVPAPTAAVVTPVLANTPAAQPAPAKQVVAPVAATPAPAEKLVMAKVKAPVAPASPDELAARVATLEKRLARYERSEARERAQAERVAQIRLAAAAPAPSWKRAPAASAVETRKPAVLSNESVRVVGVSTRHGVTTALVDFGGAKHRVAAGETIPGLGTIDSVAVDAAGNPVVEVNGVRYQ